MTCNYQIHKVSESLPILEYGLFLVYSPTQFLKNSKWLVAEWYADNQTFYCEVTEEAITDVTHWTELPPEI